MISTPTEAISLEQLQTVEPTCSVLTDLLPVLTYSRLLFLSPVRHTWKTRLERHSCERKNNTHLDSVNLLQEAPIDKTHLTHHHYFHRESLSPSVYVCVCVCVVRAVERRTDVSVMGLFGV